MIRALIVDDDQLARSNLRRILADAHPDVEVLGEAENITDAERRIAELSPALVFLDVEMPGGSGFDLLRKLGRWDFEVIFVTGHQRYAIEAIRFSALDYLPKPADPQELSAALERFKQRRQPPTVRAQVQDQFIANIAQPAPSGFKLTLHQGDATWFVAPAEVRRCDADGNYTRISLNDGRRFIMARTLMDFEEMLAPFEFLRLSRGALVARKAITNLSANAAVLDDGEHVPVSRRRMGELKERLAR